MLSKLRAIHKDALELRKLISAVKTERISKKSICTKAEDLGTRWFSDISDGLASQHILSSDLFESYSAQFNRLIKVSARNNLKTSYTQILQGILKGFRDDLIIPLQTQPKNVAKVSLLSRVLDGLTSTEENVYLKEAIDCASHNFYRAAVVLGWCAAVDRIHKTIEKEGFPKFNITSASMASERAGRFKKFTSMQNVSTLSELREVFDTILLWVIEGMEYIDSNQHTRLRSCFDMRCQCAHPGDAPITEFNLLSYFSDINEIILKNPKFAVT
jgi:hypothetical protein